MGFFQNKKRVAACKRPCGMSGFMTNQPCACHYSKNSRVAVCMQAATRLVFILNLYPLFLFLIVCPEVEAMSL